MSETIAYNAAVQAAAPPPRVRDLPIQRGYPVPWFCARLPDGSYDFRVVDTPKLGVAWRQRRCWICGGPLGRIACALLGPMCVVNRVSSEPPSHRDCAEFAARACPFLVQPRMRRNALDLPAEHVSPPGIAIERNPGVLALWLTRGWKPFQADARSGVLFAYAEDPLEVTWWTQGRPAAREEVLDAMAAGLPTLQAMAEQEGEAAAHALNRALWRTSPLLPP